MKNFELIEKMIAFYHGNAHDVNHFLKVYTYAQTIAEGEDFEPHAKQILEWTAIVHDIACPLCREKYGSAIGKKQEEESPALLNTFFEGTDVDKADFEKIVWLVAHHHTYTDVVLPEHRILLEADYLVNAGEGGYPTETIRKARENVFRAPTGKRLLDCLYLP